MDIYVQISSVVVNCSVETLKASSGHLQSSGLHRSQSIVWAGLSLLIAQCPRVAGRHSSYCPSHNRSKSPAPSRHHSQYYPDYHADPEPHQRPRGDPGDPEPASVTPGTSRKHADNCHRSQRGGGNGEPVPPAGGGEQREHRHHRRRHHKHRQMSGGDHGEAGAELSVPVTSYQTVESGLY